MRRDLRNGRRGKGSFVSIWSHWAWPLATAILGFVYVGLLVKQYVARRKIHQLMWAIGFLIYAVAAVMEFWSEASGTWDPTLYRFYIVFAACMVGFLGNGTLYLLAKDRRWGHAYLAFNIVCIVIFLVGTFSAVLDPKLLVAGITVAGKPLGATFSFPRIMSFAFNIPGSLLLIGGSVISIVKFWPKQQFRYRVWANVLIIIGTLVIAAAGGMARAGQSAGLYPAEMVASAILLWGFLKASTLEKGAKAVREARSPE
jgi:hypothetical protein